MTDWTYERALGYMGDNKMTGTVVRLLGTKGFGFIEGENKIQYFFHRQDFNGFFDDLVSDMDGGRKVVVTFEIAEHSPKGPRARDVVRVDGGV